MAKRYALRQDAKKDNWWSRSHSTSQPQMDARDAHEEHQIQKVASALVRKEEREARTDEEQLKRLDIMFGKDKGAKKERARLRLRLPAQTTVEK